MDEEFKNETKEQLLLRRVFKLIYMPHFTDHKMIASYCKDISFDRSLGDEIGNYIQAKYPKYYHAKRKEVERWKRKSLP